MPRPNLTRPRLFTLGIAVTIFAFSACGHSGSSPTPIATSTPTPLPSGIATIGPCSSSLGVAYEPDAGNGGSLHGVQVVHFEDTLENLCSATDTPATPAAVTFAAPVEQLGLSPDASNAVALMRGTGGFFTLAQDVFGSSIASLVPVGMPYDLSQTPSPAPTASGTATPVPGVPLISDGTSISILGGGTQGIALVLGSPSPGSIAGIVALTSLTNAPPQYGNAVPLSCPTPPTPCTYTLTSIPNLPRTIVRTGISSSNINVLVRGPQDLLSFGVTVVATGYQFDAEADDTTLGSNSTLRGRGALDFDPSDATKALVGGTSAGGNNILTLVTGLPAAITKTSTLALGGNIRSIKITSTGEFALVGTDVGIYVVGGISEGVLTLVTPFAVSPANAAANAIPYTTCTGSSAAMTNVHSVEQSADGKYLVALGTATGVSCPSGYNDSVVAIRFNPATGATPTPAPSPTGTSTPQPVQFTQNNVIAPPAGSDVLAAH